MHAEYLTAIASADADAAGLEQPEGGLLSQLTQRLVERALEVEITAMSRITSRLEGDTSPSAKRVGPSR